MTIHNFKVRSDSFAALWDRLKTAELRKHDRCFVVGEALALHELAEPPEADEPTGRFITATISHVQAGYGVPDGYVMLSLARMRNSDSELTSRRIAPDGQPEEFWKTQDGRVYAIEDMAPDHLRNVLRHILRRTTAARLRRNVERNMQKMLDKLSNDDDAWGDE